jgi:DNA uptake protein ComE-like DNA-binding protein
MNAIRKWIRNIFGFSGREVNGFIILLPLMLFIIMAQPVYHWWVADRTQDFSEDQKILDSLVSRWEQRQNNVDDQVLAKKESAVLFPFDPNKVTIKELETLGFSKILSTRIANYRAKGGLFRVKPDLLKIYGLDSTFYSKLYAYIRLPERKDPGVEKKETNLRSEIRSRGGNDLLASFDINKADTSQLKSVYGIGPALAARILKFRDGLGGFIKREQINEVYGLDSTVVERLLKVAFIKKDFVPRKINMNVANEKEFSAHPYIKKAMANAIIAYRFQHGNFDRVEDLRKIAMIKPEDIDRILPYLKVID